MTVANPSARHFGLRLPQGDNFADLETMLRDAVDGYFADQEKPDRIRLHFVRDPELAVA